jgi:hypothetical protein
VSEQKPSATPSYSITRHAVPAEPEHCLLQQMGDTTLRLTRELAGTDLAAVAEGDQEIVATMPRGLFRYPQGLEVPLALGTLVSQWSWCGYFGDTVH